MTYLFHGVIKIIIIKSIHIKLTNNKYKHGLKNKVNLKRILIIYNTGRFFEVIIKLSIIFITSSKENGKKMSFNSINKKTTKIIMKSNIESLI